MHLVIDCSRRPVRVQALAVAMGTVPVSGVGLMPVLVASGGAVTILAESWPRARRHLSRLRLLIFCELDEVEIKCLDPKQRSV